MSTGPVNLSGGVGAGGSWPEPSGVSRKQVEQRVAQLRQSGAVPESDEVAIVVDSRSKRIIIQVRDKESGAVSLQVPAEYLIHLGEELERLFRPDGYPESF